MATDDGGNFTDQQEVGISARDAGHLWRISCQRRQQSSFAACLAARVLDGHGHLFFGSRRGRVRYRGYANQKFSGAALLRRIGGFISEGDLVLGKIDVEIGTEDSHFFAYRCFNPIKASDRRLGGRSCPSAIGAWLGRHQDIDG